MTKYMDAPALIRVVKSKKNEGFRIEMPEGRAARIRVIAPSGETVVMPGPAQRTSARALLNARAALRRAGVKF